MTERYAKLARQHSKGNVETARSTEGVGSNNDPRYSEHLSDVR
jgi:hypothetical protein